MSTNASSGSSHSGPPDPEPSDPEPSNSGPSNSGPSSSGPSNSGPSRGSSSQARSSRAAASLRDDGLSDASVQRYYYIYDSRQRRAIVMDRTTGDEFDWSCDERTPLLDYVAECAGAGNGHPPRLQADAEGEDPSVPPSPGADALLRRFALWCARQVGADPDASPSRDASNGVLPWPDPGRSAAPEDLDDLDRCAKELRAARRLYAAAQTFTGKEGPSPDAIREKTGDEAVIASAVGLSRRHPGAARLLAAQACTCPDPRRAALDAAHMAERFAEFAAHVAGDATPEAAALAMRRRQIDWLLDQLGKSGT